MTATHIFKMTPRTAAFLVAGIAVGMAASGSAKAQSNITLYGVADDAITYVNNQNGHSNTYLRTGDLNSTKWGLRGREELGDGNAAIFDMQAGYDINSGSESQSGTLFNRQALVGLTNKRYGTLTAGRQYTPYYQLIAPLISSTVLTGATGSHPGDIDGLDTTVRINQSVLYMTPTWYGMQAAGMIGFGGVAGSTGSGQTWSAALRYASGPIALAAGYFQIDNAHASTTGAAFDTSSSGTFGTSVLNQGYLTARSLRHAAVAANYTISRVRVGVSYSNVRYLAGGLSTFASTAVFNTYAGLAAWQVNSAFNVAAGAAYTLASKGNGVSSAARYQQYSFEEGYKLSKRTTVYAVQAMQRATGQTLNAAGVVVAAAPAIGDSQDLTPSSTHWQVVTMLGLSVTF